MRETAGLLVTLVVSILLAPLPADAQPAGKISRIGLLLPGTGTASYFVSHRLEPFRQGLRELGWVDGQNVVIEYRFGEGRADRLAELAAEFVRQKVDVIVTAATPAARAAKNATATIPIVIVDPGDPVSTGLVASLARPGGNVTGVTSVAPDLAAKRLQLLKEAAPGISRVAVLWNSAIPPVEVALKELQLAAPVLGVQLQSVEVQGPKGFENAFATISKEHATALFVFPDPLTFNHRELIVDFAVKGGIPAMFGARAELS